MTAKKIKTRKKSKLQRDIKLKTSQGPEYMVQINDSMMVRKDILESLREVIIFMQGYEKFREIQEKKVALFTVLKEDVKELKTLIDSKLYKLMPKGKMPVMKEEEREKPKQEEGKVKPVKAEAKPKEAELTKLEMQLKDIENQLSTIR